MQAAVVAVSVAAKLRRLMTPGRHLAALKSLWKKYTRTVAARPVVLLAPVLLVLLLTGLSVFGILSAANLDASAAKNEHQDGSPWRQSLLRNIEQGSATLSGPGIQDNINTRVLIVPVFIHNVTSANETWGKPAAPWGCPEGLCWQPNTQTKWWGAVVLDMDLDVMVGELRDDVLDGHDLELVKHAQPFHSEADDVMLWSTSEIPCALSDNCLDASVSLETDLFSSKISVRVWKRKGWYPAYRAPLVAAVVIASLLLGVFVFMLMAAWCENHVLVRRLLPETTAQKYRENLWESNQQPQDLSSLQSDTPANHMLDMIRFMMAGLMPSVEQMAVVQEALQQGRNVYKPLAQEVGLRMKAAQHLDVEVRQALLDQLVGMDGKSFLFATVRQRMTSTSVTPTRVEQDVQHPRPPSLSLDMDFTAGWSQEGKMSSPRPACYSTKLHALEAVPEGQQVMPARQHTTLLTCSTCPPKTNAALDAWAEPLIASEAFPSLTDAFGHLMRTCGHELRTDSSGRQLGEALVVGSNTKTSSRDTNELELDFLIDSSPLSLTHVPVLQVERLLNKVGHLDFDAFTFERATNGHPLSVLGFWVLHKNHLIRDLGLHEVRLARFLRAVEAAYPDNPYHNRKHATDVLQKMFVLLTSGGLGAGYTDKLTSLACYLAAIVHDVEHVGRSNGYLVNTQHPLAIRYNDRSPMENHHLAAAWQFLRNPSLNFLAGLPAVDSARLRKLVIELVLGTDMQQQFSICSQWGVLLEASQSRSSDDTKVTPDAGDIHQMYNKTRSASIGSDALRSASDYQYPTVLPVSETERLLGLQMALKCCDLGHLAAPLAVHLKWVSSLEAEFFLQGDVERFQGLAISPLCDRNKEGVTKSQVGFFEVVALPIVTLFTRRFPAAYPFMRAVNANYKY